MNILFFNEDIPLPKFPKSKIAIWISHCIAEEGFIAGNINFIFVSDEYLLKMNQEYLNHDYFTDVITFDYCEEKTINGDVFISVPRIIENAKNFRQEFTDELFRVMIHGILHLIGYHDKTNKEKQQMHSKEDAALEKLKNYVE